MQRILILVCILAIHTSTQAEEPKQSINELRAYFTTAFQIRKGVLEKVHCIQFDPLWEPVVTIGLPDNAEQMKTERIWAQYDPPTGQFFINSQIESILRTGSLTYTNFAQHACVHHSSEEKSDVLKLVDHELGHAYADQVSRKLGLGQFPPHTEPSVSYERKFGARIVSEGIGTWFGSTSLYGRTSELGGDAFPAFTVDQRWNNFYDSYYIYESGIWLTQPTLDYNVQKGIEYLVRHPLEYENGYLREPARLYRKELLYSLPEEAHYNYLLKEVARSIENKESIRFLSNPPDISFGIPSHIPAENHETFTAHYEPCLHQMVLHPRYRSIGILPLIENIDVAVYTNVRLREIHEMLRSELMNVPNIPQ